MKMNALIMQVHSLSGALYIMTELTYQFIKLISPVFHVIFSEPWRLMYFQVFIGNTTDVESAQMIHEDKQQPPPNVTTVTLMEVAIGRYFFVRLPAKNSILTLCEVEVFGGRYVDSNKYWSSIMGVNSLGLFTYQ